ncbi:YfbM family protein [Nocardia sp. BMG51109]|uniref:YfbM family protein n=1 Tax=Nocardia sp. BMG51109 TaxID=1056816 RepID=UPI0004647A74|nr:YfbM family protein [Nocardia sp. BMG51109]
MGMVMSFSRVTPAELNRIDANPENVHEFLWSLDRDGEPDGYLDKAWDGLRYLFEAAHLGLDLYMEGESIGSDGTLSAWDADLVHRAADLLRSTPFERLARCFDPGRMTAQNVYPNIWYEGAEALDYLRVNYDNLVRFFEFAAAGGSGAIMSFG